MRLYFFLSPLSLRVLMFPSNPLPSPLLSSLHPLCALPLLAPLPCHQQQLSTSFHWQPSLYLSHSLPPNPLLPLPFILSCPSFSAKRDQATASLPFPLPFSFSIFLFLLCHATKTPSFNTTQN